MFWPPGPSVESCSPGAKINVLANRPGSGIPSTSQIMSEEGAPFEKSQPTMHEGVEESKGGCEILHPHRESIQPSLGGERS